MSDVIEESEPPHDNRAAGGRLHPLVGLLLFLAVIFIASCSPSEAEVVEKYTEQTARAIIEGSWKVAGAIVFAAFIRGMMNK